MFTNFITPARADGILPSVRPRNPLSRSPTAHRRHARTQNKRRVNDSRFVR
jgi:hypothetical protein